MGRAWRPSLKKEEDEEEEERRVRNLARRRTGHLTDRPGDCHGGAGGQEAGGAGRGYCDRRGGGFTLFFIPISQRWEERATTCTF